MSYDGMVRIGNDNAYLIPERMFTGINNYLYFGIEPGGFLYRLFCNDFLGALGRADLENQRCLMGYGYFMYNYMPISSIRSEENVKEWIRTGGLIGNSEINVKPMVKRLHEVIGDVAYKGEIKSFLEKSE